MTENSITEPLSAHAVETSDSGVPIESGPSTGRAQTSPTSHLTDRNRRQFVRARRRRIITITILIVVAAAAVALATIALMHSR
ncbi:hypothetical protein KPL76_05970 [Subtercola sp. PAMC28395]|uniref:hypothetical protein n=1 Tax=Subtercola sp. PAMC28395 TaxID=2846775 RepID=UPI001C0C5E07|nr:hypothetical protein [Subtercola sp. PAMC28395]QWT24905.1 hypothetical protein KPL76_05970 [Subtercola sp. PAMC28395]